MPRASVIPVFIGILVSTFVVVLNLTLCYLIVRPFHHFHVFKLNLDGYENLILKLLAYTTYNRLYASIHSYPMFSNSLDAILINTLISSFPYVQTKSGAGVIWMINRFRHSIHLALASFHTFSSHCLSTYINKVIQYLNALTIFGLLTSCKRIFQFAITIVIISEYVIDIYL